MVLNSVVSLAFNWFSFLFFEKLISWSIKIVRISENGIPACQKTNGKNAATNERNKKSKNLCLFWVYHQYKG